MFTKKNHLKLFFQCTPTLGGSSKKSQNAGVTVEAVNQIQIENGNENEGNYKLPIVGQLQDFL